MKYSSNVLLIAVSPGISKILQNIDINHNAIEYLETGYDEQLFSKIEKTNIYNDNSENAIKFIYGGSLKIQGSEKGIKNLIKCFHHVCIENSIDNIYFDIYCSSKKKN